VALQAFAARHRLDQIVTLRPDVGPLGDVLPELLAKLADQGVHLALVDRPCDLALRPLARAGFFKFWETLQSPNPDEQRFPPWVGDGRGLEKFKV
jgi:hypothetical protein